MGALRDYCASSVTDIRDVILRFRSALLNTVASNNVNVSGFQTARLERVEGVEMICPLDGL